MFNLTLCLRTFIQSHLKLIYLISLLASNIYGMAIVRVYFNIIRFSENIKHLTIKPFNILGIILNFSYTC